MFFQYFRILYPLATMTILTANHSSIGAQLLVQLQHPMCLLLLQIILILLVSRIFGLIFARLRQPAVIGEIVAGIFLGASVFGSLWPHFFNVVFPTTSIGNLDVLSKIGLAFFMFIIGMELDLNELKRKATSVLIISSCSIAIPFMCGIGLAFYLYPQFSMPGVSFLVFSIFIGISLSITAFPVLARIIKNRALQKTSFGTLVLSIAALSDVLAWCILAIIITIAKSGSFSMTMFTLIGTLVFILLMLFVVRPFLEKLISRLRTAHYGDSNVVVLSFIVLLLSAFISEFIGIHMLFGAFLAGILIPHNDTLKQALSSKLEDVSVLLLLPIFFALTGLRLHVSLLDTRDMVFVCVGIVLVATIGKFIGSALPARLLGMNWKDSICIGIFMNTRGLMELVVLNIGYELGILSPALFAILTIMAIITTIITSPLLDLTEYFFRRKNIS